MRLFVLVVSLLFSISVIAAQNVYLVIRGETQVQAMAAAEKGYDYHKAQGARTVTVDTSRSSSTDKRKQSLYFPESMSGFFLSPQNELLHIKRGELVGRMKVRASVKKRALPEVDDEVLTNAEPSKKKLPTKKKKPHK